MDLNYANLQNALVTLNQANDHPATRPRHLCPNTKTRSIFWPNAYTNENTIGYNTLYWIQVQYSFTLDKPSRLRFSVFVKVNENNYRYWDGNAVYFTPQWRLYPNTNTLHIEPYIYHSIVKFSLSWSMYPKTNTIHF